MRCQHEDACSIRSRAVSAAQAIRNAATREAKSRISSSPFEMVCAASREDACPRRSTQRNANLANEADHLLHLLLRREVLRSGGRRHGRGVGMGQFEMRAMQSSQT